MLRRFDPLPLRVDVDGRRHYQIPDLRRLVPSVTTVLASTLGPESWGLRAWRERLDAIEPGAADLARDIAARRGERLHARLTRALEERRPFAREELAADGWLRSLEPTVRQWLVLAELDLAEGAVWQGFDGYAGTVDFVLRMLGRWIWDLKSALTLRTHEQMSHGIAQLGGYVDAFRWTYEEDPRGCGLLIALPDRPAQVVIVKPDEAVGAWRSRFRDFSLRGCSSGITPPR